MWKGVVIAPRAVPWRFRFKAWFSGRRSLERMLREAITQAPEITKPSRLPVSVERDGIFSSRRGIHLIGRTTAREDKQRAQEIVERNVNQDWNIINEIRVE
jgi:hypothetical protein